MPNKNSAQAISPESQPSVAETSYASSQDDDGSDNNKHSVVRALFGRGKQQRIPKEIVENIDRISNDELRDDDRDCAVSITSSETTVVASRNLTFKSTPTKAGSFPSIFSDPSEDNDDESPHDNDAQTKKTQPSNLDFEEPPQATASCNNALSLTPKQLADIFLAFEGAQRIWPPNKPAAESNEDGLKDKQSPTNAASVSSPIRADGWMPRAESLERECIALKKIIQEDSAKLLNLRSAMEAQRDLNSLKDTELQQRSVELQIAEERLLLVKREREESRERESELVETIRILKAEVDTLTRFKSTMEALKSNDEEENESVATQCDAEIEQMREKLDLFASQISKQEKTIEELQNTVESKEEEACRLRNELATLKEERQASKGIEEHGKSPEPKQPNNNLTEILLNISQRLEAVESEKDLTKEMYSTELKQKNDEIQEMRRRLGKEGNERAGRQSAGRTKATGDHISISEDPDEIEVSMPPKRVTPKDPKPEDPCCCVLVPANCDVFSVISGDGE